MELVRHQEEFLKRRAHDAGRFDGLIFFYAALRRLDAVHGSHDAMDPANDHDRLVYDLVLLDENPGLAGSILERLANLPDPWVCYSLTKFHLRAGNVSDALRVAEVALGSPQPDASAVNLVIKYLAQQGEQALRSDLIERSLAANSTQQDVGRLKEEPFTQALYLDPLPKHEPLDFYLPVYNVEQYVRAAIEGLLLQTYPLHRILVIDDGSRDHSIAIAREYPVQIIEHSENKGLAAARNTAFQHSTADFVGAIDTDASPDPNYSRNVMMEFENAGPNVAGVGGKLIETNTATPADKWRALRMAQHHGDCRVHPPSILYGSNNILRRSAVLAVGGYDETFRTNSEDVHLCWSLRDAGFSYVYTPRAVAYHARKDTLASVLATAWNWHYWAKVENDVYDSHKGMVDMMYNALNKCVKEMNRFMEAVELDALYVEFLFVFYDIFRDLLHVREKGLYEAGHVRYVQDRMLEPVARLDARLGGGLCDKLRTDLAGLLVDASCDADRIEPAFKEELEGFFAEVGRLCDSCSPELYDVLAA